MADAAGAPAMRRSMRQILAGDACVHPASIYDAMTARAAAKLGYQVGMLGGSVAALAVLGAPDHTLLSLDELAGLCRRICRTGALPLIVDADHGFGNALNAMRCVEELENAGVAALTLEDTLLPRPFGAADTALISLEEARGKVAAAIAARRDPSLVVAARTDARLQDTPELTRRAEAYADAGADAVFLTGVRTREEVEAVRAATGLPILLAAAKGELEGADLAALGVRVCLTGHRTFPAALAAAWDTLAGGSTASRPDPAALVKDLSDTTLYAGYIARYLSLPAN
ncbi:isocitrate lyase/PEP mutase family protein [Acuticoccus mangrovi]|uniref:Isocitrate lyase/PEP mutase family protein n=1 Tax=Acuticoccus mangrovi TaxID=2796142 RepID=A0A934ME45_9HYPH|nr:isocitrate lyase/PEP mutase family protein [Acuticoccus mangrovi]MBJ3777087.1 isocitrate lyase/PEP mutase family protein [Acuticoccus mangrovi]